MDETRDTFTALVAFLRPPAPPPEGTVAAGDLPERSNAADDVQELCSQIRRFRAALDDALEMRLEELLADIAAGVLARELELAPCAIRAIVDRGRSRMEEACPLRVRVHPSEVASFPDYDLPVAGDPSLRRGDAQIDLRAGTIDASLGVRLENVLVR